MEMVISMAFCLILGFGIGVITYSWVMRAKEREIDARYNKWWYEHQQLINKDNKQ